MTDVELAQRSVRGFGEMLALLARWGVGPDAEVRRPDAVGGRIAAAADNPWFDGAVVPVGVTPPADDPLLPGCLWAVADAAAGRVEDPGIATPCLGLDLADLAAGDTAAVEVPSLAVVGDLNERAYGQAGVFTPLVSAVRDDRVRALGLRDGGAFVCVALTLTLGDDLNVQYVATEASHRRQGLASRLLRSVLTAGRESGMRTATLQASPDGLGVYERLGFRRVATLRGFRRP